MQATEVISPKRKCEKSKKAEEMNPAKYKQHENDKTYSGNENRNCINEVNISNSDKYSESGNTCTKSNRRVHSETNDSETADEKNEGNSNGRVLGLIDIYENNPGLQRIGKKKKKLQHVKHHKSEDNVILKRATARRSVCVHRNRHDLKPLPPKVAKLRKRKRTPRKCLKRRLKLENIQENIEKKKNKDTLTEKNKCSKSLSRYNKSEFDILTELDNMKVTAETYVLPKPSVSTITTNDTDKESVTGIKQMSVSKVPETEAVPYRGDKVCIKIHCYAYRFCQVAYET